MKVRQAVQAEPTKKQYFFYCFQLPGGREAGQGCSERDEMTVRAEREGRAGVLVLTACLLMAVTWDS